MGIPLATRADDVRAPDPERSSGQGNRPSHGVSGTVQRNGRNKTGGAGSVGPRRKGGGALTVPEAWDRIPMVADAPKYGRRARIRLITSRPADPASKAFDVLRTRLLRALQVHGWKRIGVAAPTAGCGGSFTTANLGLSLARLPTVRTLMVDLDLASPGLAKSFDIRRTGPLESMLAGEVMPEEHLFRVGPNLAFALNDEPVIAPAGRLQDPGTWSILDGIQSSLAPDVTLCDLPPLLSGDAAEAVLPQVDGLLLVSDGTRTTAKEIAECERLLENQTPLLGVVLNRAESSGKGTPAE